MIVFSRSTGDNLSWLRILCKTSISPWIISHRALTTTKYHSLNSQDSLLTTKAKPHTASPWEQSENNVPSTWTSQSPKLLILHQHTPERSVRQHNASPCMPNGVRDRFDSQHRTHTVWVYRHRLTSASVLEGNCGPRISCWEIRKRILTC